MKRLQIYLDQSLDEALARRARREHTSKAALVRDALRKVYAPESGGDPFDEWAGGIDEAPGDIDAVVYGA